MIPLKNINYRGGIVRFRVPSSWVEEYEPEGGGTFYEDAPDTGTLRINVMGFEQRASEASTIETAHAMLARLHGSDNVEQLPGGVAVARSNKRTVEGDEELLIYTWQVGVRVLPAYFRLVVFTFTILSGHEYTPAIQQELQLIDKLITEAEYPAVRGEADDYTHEP